MTITAEPLRPRAESDRCLVLESLFERAFGGLLPELPDQAAFAAMPRRVLDVGCGLGTWALELARRHRALDVSGIDISPARIADATRRARRLRVHRVRFEVMDARAPLRYPDGHFDLVNVRCVQLPRSGWPALLRELFRITTPGGVVRLIDSDDAGVTTSPAYERLSELFLQACRIHEIAFSPTGRSLGLAPALVRIARDAGYTDIGIRAAALHWSSKTDAHAAVAEDMVQAFGRAVPFIASVGLARPDEVAQLVERLKTEVEAEDFCALWTFWLISGSTPRR